MANLTIAILREDCDCGSQVRHNNGGNYHNIEDLCYNPETKKYELWKTSTSEFDEWEKWSTMSYKAFEKMLRIWQNKKHGKGFDLTLTKKITNLQEDYDYDSLRERCKSLMSNLQSHEKIVRCALVLGVIS